MVRGGKLAADLTWPKLRQRWSRSGTAPGDRLTPAERDSIWEHAARTADDTAARIRLLTGNDPTAAADAAWAAGDTLHVAAAALGSRVLRQAADAYDRAARAPYGRIPPSSPAGDCLRQAARLLSAFAFVSGDRSISRLARLAEAVSVLRQAQQRAAQAASALGAAERLHAAAGTLLAPDRGQRAAVRSVVALADAGFPLPSRLYPVGSPAPETRRPAQSGPRLRRRRGR